MAVRTSTTPRGRTSQSDFDALIRQEMGRLGTRGGEDRTQEARDIVAKRLNKQEGLGRTSSAYRPAQPAPDRRSSSGRNRGGGGRKPSGGKPSSGLPDSTDVVPQDRPPDPGDTGGWPMWLLPLLAVASKKGQSMMGGPRGKEEFFPPDTPVKPNVVPPNKMPVVIDNADYGNRPLPIANAPEGTRALTYSPQAALPPPTEDALTRFMTDAEIQRAQAGADPIRRMMEGMDAPAGARSGPNVYRPGVEAPVETPGLHGSRYRQPILRYGG